MQLLLVFVACVLVAGWDWMARRVPNNLLVTLATAQAALVVTGHAQFGLLSCLAGLCLGFFGLLPFYLTRVMGAGDVKYGALIGFICGPMLLCLALLIAGLLAGAHALFGFSTIVSPVLSRVTEAWKKTRVDRYLSLRREGRCGIPYAAYISVGVLYWQFVRHVS